MSENTDSIAPGIRSQRLLQATRKAWLVLALALFVVFVLSVPATYGVLQTVCLDTWQDCGNWAQPTPEALAALEASGMSLQASALFLIVLFTGTSLIFWTLGLLIYRHRPHGWFALLVAHVMVLNGAGGVSLVFSSGSMAIGLPEWVGWLIALLTIPMYQFLSLFFLLFPNGRFYGRWNAIPFILICLNTVAWVIPSTTFNIQYWSPLVSSLWLMVVYGSHLLVQVIRYRRMYTPIERQQTKWLIFGFSIPVAIFLLSGLLLGDDPAAGVHPIVNGTLTTLIYLPLGLAMGIAILRYRLWDIDVIINRTLVFAMLTAILVLVYALVVTSLSQLVRVEGNFVVSLLGAGVVAVLFQPLRQRLQDAINRLMFGRRDEPLAVMLALGKSLDAVLSPQAALQHVVEATARTLKLPYVALEQADAEPVAVGRVQGSRVSFPLVYQAQPVGQLVVSTRSPAESLNPADRLVLEQVARQASSIVHAWRLTADLQKSRQQILSTREEERRRLRRDLHDGLGPALATLTLQAEAAREWLRRDPDKSEALLDAIIGGSETVLVEIRRIAYALRPPALDDLGLLSAIREQANQFTSGRVRVTFESPDCLPPLPAAVEVAAYRIVQEALTNVTRHAQAHSCKVSMSVNGHVELMIADDGIGIPNHHRTGIGLNSIYERVSELGGVCEITSAPGQGTRIRVAFPRE